jgi:hypothetical protein
MNIFTKKLLLCLCIVVYTSASAQSADSTKRPLDSTFHTVFSTTGSLNKTETGDAYLLNNNLNFIYNTRKSALTTFASWVYGQLNHTLTNNDFTSSVNLDYLKNVQKLYYWGLFNYQTSYSLKTKYRLQPGIGVGYSFVKKDNAVFLVSDGILFEMADLTDAKFGKEKYQTFRNSLRVKYHFVIGKIITLDGTNFWQPSLAEFKDYNLLFANSVSLKLNEWLNFTSALNYNKISRTGSETLLLTFGITLDKYF